MNADICLILLISYISSHATVFRTFTLFTWTGACQHNANMCTNSLLPGMKCKEDKREDLSGLYFTQTWGKAEQKKKRSEKQIRRSERGGVIEW